MPKIQGKCQVDGCEKLQLKKRRHPGFHPICEVHRILKGGGPQPGQIQRPIIGTKCFICGETIGRRSPVVLEENGWRHAANCLSSKKLKGQTALEKELLPVLGYRFSVRDSLKRLGE